MKHFCVANPDASLDNAKATGDKDFVGKTLRNFVIHQIRCKETEKSTTTDHTVTKSTAKVKQYHWWSEEVMDREIGAEKAKDWRDSGKLCWRPDIITKSTAKHAIEWATPIEYESITEDELDAIRMRATGECDAVQAQGDLEALTDRLHGGGCAATTTAVVPDEPSELDKLAARITELKKNIKDTFEQFQRLEIETKLIKKYAENPSQSKCPYHIQLATDCGKQIRNVTELVKVLEQMVVEEFSDSEVPKIIQKIDAANVLNETILFWAARCGYESITSPTPKKRSRRGGKGV